ncbi:MAG: PASTA domain-containing protein [Candidatus Saccharibacteria bacterium]|nr:PASTA domain-containing protein [Candidatus Saccharibacteria bacterium]
MKSIDGFKKKKDTVSASSNPALKTQGTHNKISNRRAINRQSPLRNPLAIVGIILAGALIAALIIVNIPKSEFTRVVDVPDFSDKNKSEIIEWCSKENVNCKFDRDFSDDVGKGNYLSQSTPAGSQIGEGSDITITDSLGPSPGEGRYKEALLAIEDYVERDHMSKTYAYNFFVPEYKEAVTKWAVDNAFVDWYTICLARAGDYFRGTAYDANDSVTLPQYTTRTTIRQALRVDKFTESQIEFAMEYIAPTVNATVQD